MTVPELQVAKVRHGIKARIRVDAFPTQSFEGTVVEVAPLPNPPLMGDGEPKVYTTKVRIDDGIPGLRPGMTARVELLLANRENVLTVPVESVASYDEKDHLAVRKPGGGIELREVKLGLSNGKLVEVTQGIESGEKVVLNPVEFMRQLQSTPVTQPSTSSGSSRSRPGRKP